MATLGRYRFDHYSLIRHFAHTRAPADPAPWLQLVAKEFATRPWFTDFTREWAAAGAADPDTRMKALAKAAAETADGLVALRRAAAERRAAASK